MGTTADKLQAVLDSKMAIKEALTEKGLSPTDSLSSYAELIESYETAPELSLIAINPESTSELRFPHGLGEALNGAILTCGTTAIVYSSGGNFAYVIDTEASTINTNILRGGSVTNGENALVLNVPKAFDTLQMWYCAGFIGDKYSIGSAWGGSDAPVLG